MFANFGLSSTFAQAHSGESNHHLITSQIIMTISQFATRFHNPRHMTMNFPLLLLTHNFHLQHLLKRFQRQPFCCLPLPAAAGISVKYFTCQPIMLPFPKHILGHGMSPKFTVIAFQREPDVPPTTTMRIRKAV